MMLFVLVVYIGVGILLFRKFFRSFAQKNLLKVLAISAFLVPLVALVFMAVLSSMQKTYAVKVVDVTCTGHRIFPGIVRVIDSTTKKPLQLLLPISWLEEGGVVVFDSAGRPFDGWYNSYFCQKGEIFEKEIKDVPLFVTVNGYNRILSWKLQK